jgi:hypothetical protein
MYTAAKKGHTKEERVIKAKERYAWLIFPQLWQTHLLPSLGYLEPQKDERAQ